MSKITLLHHLEAALVKMLGLTSEVATSTSDALEEFEQELQNHSHNAMTGATASAAGKAGFVPAPAAGKQEGFLKGDGTWEIPSVNLSLTDDEVTAIYTELYSGS